MDRVENPLIIIGVGRSGSTILHNLLAYHPNLAWLSSLCNHFPRYGQFNHLLLGAVDMPGIGPVVRNRFGPEEPYDFWEMYCPGFRRPKRDLVASDVAPDTVQQLHHELWQMQTAKRRRWLIKLTGWPRIGYLKRIFPGAKFIHLVRDGRAVAYSLLNVDFWRGRQGPEGWRWGALPPELDSKWKQFDQSTVALAGIQWHLLLQAVEKASMELEDSNFLVVKYEDLCANPTDTLDLIIEFCSLPLYRPLSKRAEYMIQESQNDKWQTRLPEEEQYILDDVTRHYREKFGYR